jgi:hypothetical protein
MRPVPQTMADAWRSGQYIGDQRPIARVTVQTGDMQLYSTANNQYAAYQFNSNKIPKELPNVLSVSWQRSLDSDFGSASITLINTANVAGAARASGSAQADGWYAPLYGVTDMAKAWSQLPNTWSHMLLPDNIVRTYEGYGCDPDSPPERDPHLVITGVWRIDSVSLTADGRITLTCRDIASILDKQILFPPVVPKKFYPLQFAGVDTAPGWSTGSTKTLTYVNGGTYDRDHPPPGAYDGPTYQPAVWHATAGDGQITVTWAHPIGGDPSGYRVDGYQITVDGVRLPTVYYDDAGSAVLRNGIMNGNVYAIGFVAIWEQLLTGAQRAAAKAAGRSTANPRTYSDDVLHLDNLMRPASPLGPDVIADSLHLDLTTTGAGVPAMVSWACNTKGRASHWTLIAYRGGTPPAEQRIYHVDLPAGATTGQVQTDIGDNMQAWNYLLYGTGDYTPAPVGGKPAPAATVTGAGQMFFRSAGDEAGSFWAPPVAGAAPRATTVVGGLTVDHPVTGGSAASGAPRTGNKTRIPAKPVRLAAKFDDSSNTYYVTRTGAVFGHRPEHAFDDAASTFWMSIGNISPARGFAYEWLQAAVPGNTVSSVTVHTKLSGYQLYVSVFAHGVWNQFSPHDVIPYDAHLPESHNHANIPFAATFVTGRNDEGPHKIVLRSPIPGVTKVRVTLRNLQDFNAARLSTGYAYRGAIRALTVEGTSGGGTGGEGGGAGGGPGGVSPIDDSTDPTTIQTYETYIPPKLTTGAGAHPGTMNDYTDVIKLMLGWGGFFWPHHARQMHSDGSYQLMDWGLDDQGMPNVDPVLGGLESGRIWGDLMSTGTHAAFLIPMSTWDKQSLMAGIQTVKDIIGFNFWCDETGGAIWRLSNIYSIGNWISDPVDETVRTSAVLTIDENQTLMGLTSTYSGASLRERIFVGLVDGTAGAMAAAYNPNPTGLRRVGGWTDQRFTSLASSTTGTNTSPGTGTGGTGVDDAGGAPILGEGGVTVDPRRFSPRGVLSVQDPNSGPTEFAGGGGDVSGHHILGGVDPAVKHSLQIMADMIQMRALMNYHGAQIQIPGYPLIQIDDQIRISEHTTAEDALHYVKAISSSNDVASGSWTYTIDTCWLGTDPGNYWLFETASLPEETREFLEALKIPAPEGLPVGFTGL